MHAASPTEVPPNFITCSFEFIIRMEITKGKSYLAIAFVPIFWPECAQQRNLGRRRKLRGRIASEFRRNEAEYPNLDESGYKDGALWYRSSIQKGDYFRAGIQRVPTIFRIRVSFLGKVTHAEADFADSR